MMRRCNWCARAFHGVLPVAICALLALLPAAAAHARIIGINHTHWAINHFAVDGHSGLDVIGAWQGGGGGHISLPTQWVPGMTVRVDWERGSAYTPDFPGYADWPKYLIWREKVVEQRRQQTRHVLVPDYTSQKVCGITVHFLPCDEIQVTTSCHGYGHPDYPIKTPLHLPEPQSCPASSSSAPEQGAPS